MTSESAIPVLDLSHFTPGGPHERTFIERLGTALREIAFFAVVNHGVDRALIARAYRAAVAFFELPEEQKRQYEDPASHGQRGFTSFGTEHARNNSAPDLKEFWHVGRESRAGAELAQTRLSNIWPAEIPDFRPSTAGLYEQLEACAARMLEAVALYLDEPRDLISGMAVNGNTLLRLIHYPPLPEGSDPESLRSAPHEDINLITLLCEATAGGLEVQSRDGRWLPVEARPGEIVVDAGDMLQNLTNGVLRSTTHRVVNPDNSREPRFSMPFFVHPRPEVNLSPLPGCIALSGGERRFPTITAGEYLERRLREIGLLN